MIAVPRVRAPAGRSGLRRSIAIRHQVMRVRPRPLHRSMRPTRSSQSCETSHYAGVGPNASGCVAIVHSHAAAEVPERARAAKSRDLEVEPHDLEGPGRGDGGTSATGGKRGDDLRHRPRARPPSSDVRRDSGGSNLLTVR
jgi:hypothetical protein